MGNFNQPTGLLTPEEAHNRTTAQTRLGERLNEQKYQYELGPETGGNTKSKSISKNIINFSFVVILIVGIVGSFWEAFDMDKFVSFMEIFAYVWAPLVIAVGSGRAFKNWTEKKYTPKDVQVKPEDLPPV